MYSYIYLYTHTYIGYVLDSINGEIKIEKSNKNKKNKPSSDSGVKGALKALTVSFFFIFHVYNVFLFAYKCMNVSYGTYLNIQVYLWIHICMYITSMYFI
jgi:hypothetical protein